MTDEQRASTPAAEPAPASPVAETAATAAPAAKTRGTKRKKFVQNGQAHIQATYNNTIVTLTDMEGNVLAWSSAGKVGFRGPKKSTPYAAGIIVRDVVERTKIMGLKNLDVYVRGVGLGREAAIRALAGAGMNLTMIKDLTPMPHNGPRPPKVRRV